jgi:nitronate monooxygenase
MIRTAITEMFGIRYPIICGAMMWLCRPELCAFISNAGGMGNITAANYDTEEGRKKPGTTGSMPQGSRKAS